MAFGNRLDIREWQRARGSTFFRASSYLHDLHDLSDSPSPLMLWHNRGARNRVVLLHEISMVISLNAGIAKPPVGVDCVILDLRRAVQIDTTPSAVGGARMPAIPVFGGDPSAACEVRSASVPDLTAGPMAQILLPPVPQWIARYIWTYPISDSFCSHHERMEFGSPGIMLRSDEGCALCYDPSQDDESATTARVVMVVNSFWEEFSE